MTSAGLLRGKKLSAVRPNWKIPYCAMGAACACIRGPHVVFVVAAFNLRKFLTEMEATGGLSLVLPRRGASGFNQCASNRSDHVYQWREHLLGSRAAANGYFIIN